jgi:hypothetical protein
MHDPSVRRVPPASRQGPRQGTPVRAGRAGQEAARSPASVRAPAPATMRARYSEGSNIRRCHYGHGPASTGTPPTSSPRSSPGQPDSRTPRSALRRMAGWMGAHQLATLDVRGRGIAGPGGHGRTVCRGARPGLPSRWRASGAPVHLVEEFFCEAGTRVGTRLRRCRRIPGLSRWVRRR